MLTGNDRNNLNIIADVEIVNDNELYLNTCLFKKVKQQQTFEKKRQSGAGVESAVVLGFSLHDDL